MSDEVELPPGYFGEVSTPNPPDYTSLDKYRDFHALFASDLGRKVLIQIMKMGNVTRTSASAGNFDPYRTFYQDGMRNLAHQIFVTANVEPKPMPTHATVKPRG